jgi:hypothetical protein
MGRPREQFKSFFEWVKVKVSVKEFQEFKRDEDHLVSQQVIICMFEKAVFDVLLFHFLVEVCNLVVMLQTSVPELPLCYGYITAHPNPKS